MELGPIFRSLLNSRTRVALIVVEIALTLAIVANCVNMILDQQGRLDRPTGYDEERTIVVRSLPFDPQFEEEPYRKASFEEDLRVIREMPGVTAVAAMHQIPLSGSGSSGDWRVPGTDDDAHRFQIPYYVVSQGGMEALKLEIVAGRDFVESDWPAPEETEEAAADSGERIVNVIVTQEVADLFYPEGDAVGKLIQSGDDHNRIVGVVRQATCSWPQSSIRDRVLFYPGRGYYARRTQYVVRAEEDSVDSLYASLETEMARVNPGRIVSVRTLAEIKLNSMGELVAINKILAGISGLLLLVTSLGIVGLTSFSVTQRTRQIGTRRALGATRWGVLRYFLVENWILTTSGLAIGLVLTYGVNFLLAQVMNVPIMDLTLVLAGMVLLWLVGLGAALAPASRSMGISPVIATRTV